MSLHPDLQRLKALDAKTNETKAFTATIGEAAYHGPIGEFIKFINSRTEADPAAMLVQALVVFGNMIGFGPRIFLGDSDLHMNEYVAVVGKSAKARKGTSKSVVDRFLDPIDTDHSKRCRLNTLASGEGLIHALRDPTTTEKGPDPGVTDKRLLIEAEEFGSILTGKGRIGSTLTPQLRSAWDSKNLSNPTRNNSEFVTNPHISLIGHITAHELKALMSEVDTYNGFANRFVWVYSRKTKSVAFPEPVTPEEYAPFREPLKHALFVGKRDLLLSLSESAKDLYLTEHTRFGEESGDDNFDSLNARGLSHMMKLASIYALTDATPIINDCHLLAAKAVIDYSERSLEHIFQLDGLSKLAKRLEEIIRQSPGSSKTDHHKATGKHLKAEELETARTELINQGLITSKPDENGFVRYWPAEGELMNLMNCDDSADSREESKP